MMVEFNDVCILKILHKKFNHKSNLSCAECPLLKTCEEQSNHIKVGYTTHRRMIEERDDKIKDLEQQVNHWKGAYMKLNELLSYSKK